ISTGVALGLGNFNNDGIPDLVYVYQGIPTAMNPNGLIAILLGNGDGTFSIAPSGQTTATLNPRAVSMAVGALTGAGIRDAAVSTGGVANTTTAGTTQIFLGTAAANGTFASASPNQNITTGINSTAIVSGQFNPGGTIDLAVDNASAGTVSILSGA